MLSTQTADKIRVLGEKAAVLSRYCEKYGILMIRNVTHISICDRYKYPPMATHIAHLQFDALVRMDEEEIEEYVVRCSLDSMALTGLAGDGELRSPLATPAPDVRIM